MGEENIVGHHASRSAKCKAKQRSDRLMILEMLSLAEFFDVPDNSAKMDETGNIETNSSCADQGIH